MFNRLVGRRVAVRAAGSLPFRLLNPIIDLRRLANAAPGYAAFARDLRRYRRLPGADRAITAHLTPVLGDRLALSPFDSHYFYQDVWAAHRIADLAPVRHVDVGSRVDLVGFLTTITDVTFVDIRPLNATIKRLSSVAGNVLAMPFPDRSIESLSCLHVAEHIGLGRYGDDLDPMGTRRAALELQRTLAPGGQLLFSLPVGVPRLAFNAHRIHAPVDVPGFFKELELVEFAGVDDMGEWRDERRLTDLATAVYGCGCYRFVRP